MVKKICVYESDQQRNYAAYQSHRKRTQRKYRQWVAASRKKRKVSL